MKKYFETIVVVAFACFLFLGIKEEPTPVHAESVAGVSAAVVPDVNVEIEFMEVTPVEEAVVEVVDEAVDETVVEETPIETPVNASQSLEEVTVEEIPTEDIEAPYSVLNKRMGVNYFNGQKETYYNLPMGGVIRLMDSEGIEHGEYWVRGDGCKMLGDYIMVAGDLSVHPRGTLVETSLGTGIVCDTGDFIHYPDGSNWIDVAVTW